MSRIIQVSYSFSKTFALFWKLSINLKNELLESDPSSLENGQIFFLKKKNTAEICDVTS